MNFANFIIFLCEELHIIDDDNVIYLFCKTFMEHDWSDFDLVSSFANWILDTITDKINSLYIVVYFICNSIKYPISKGRN